MSSVTDDQPIPPPPTLNPPCRVPLKQFWKVLPAEVRQQVLAILSRMVATHLAAASPGREVSHDRH
jgi:hypothetical protein